MKYSSLFSLTSSLFLFALAASPQAYAVSTQTLLQRIEAQDQRIKQLEGELADLRRQIGISPAKPAPAPKPATPPSNAHTPPSGDAKIYVVSQGDTLTRIARSHRVSVSQLIAYNGLRSPDQIRIGDQIRIPVKGGTSTPPVAQAPAAPAPPSKPAPAPQRTVNYVIRPGDTLSSIARTHGTSVTAIIAANKLSNPDRVSVGQALRIPGASRSTASAAAPAAAQQVVSRTPDTGVARESAPAQNDFPSGYAYYTVIAGDNLYSIARIFGTTQSDLEQLNGLSSGASIKPNQQILVPMSKYSGPYRTS